ncbi:MAG: glycosyltransferase family 39 protein [PVC group bacterium]
MKNEHTIPWWVTLLCLATLVCGIAGHALWTADEPREAEIAREMAGVIRGGAEGRSCAVPYLAGKPFVEKPPLYYWLSALMMLTAGKMIGTTAAARAFSALCGAVTALLLWMVMKECLDRRRARSGALILVTTAGFFMASHWILIDPLLMLLISAAVLFFFQGLDRDRPLIILGAYLAAGLAFLTKGFVAWGLLAVPGCLLLTLHRRKVIGKPLLHLAGIVLLLGPGLAWAAAFHARGGPALWQEWFINNNIGRFSGQTTHSHIKGPFYYLGIAPVLLLPWTPLLLGGFIRRRGERLGRREPGERALLQISLAWAVGGLVLLSLAGTKRDIYLYPLLPAFAVLSLFSLNKTPPWVKVIYRFLCPVLILPAVLLAFISPDLTGDKIGLAFSLKPAVLLLAAIGTYSLFRCKKNLLTRVLSAGAVFYLTVVFAAFPLIDVEKNYEPATRRLAAAITPEQRGRVGGWQTDETTRAVFSYYTGLTLIELRDKVQPEKNLGRLSKILNGRDEEYEAVIVLLKKESEFPPEGMPPARYRIQAEEQMGKNRRLLLITGAPDTPGMNSE